jgi:hypothetical protein
MDVYTLQVETDSPDRYYIFYRMIYTFLFYTCLTTILMNIIFGIIIDTFAELREKKDQVCMYICACVHTPCMYVCMYVCIYVCVCVCVRMYVYINMYHIALLQVNEIDLYLLLYMYIYIYIHIYICMYIYTYIYTYICIHVHIHVDTYHYCMWIHTLATTCLVCYPEPLHAVLPRAVTRCVTQSRYTLCYPEPLHAGNQMHSTHISHVIYKSVHVCMSYSSSSNITRTYTETEILRDILRSIATLPVDALCVMSNA